MPKNNGHVAVLIDGDNISASSIPWILDEITKYGNPIIREVFFNKYSIEHWDQAIATYSLKPEYVPNNTSGKNAADIALVIRAMQLFYEREDLVGFCIVSSDSDFTMLSQYLVSNGKPVLGIGENKTSQSFQNACSKFICVDCSPEPQAVSTNGTSPPGPKAEPSSAKSQSFERLFIEGYELASKQVHEWVPLMSIKTEMLRLANGSATDDIKNTRRFAESVLELATYFPKGVVNVRNESGENNQSFHFVQVDCDAFKFVEAYKQAPKEQHDWVKLAVIGTQLRKYPSYKDGFTYHGTQAKKLLSVITAMTKDYGKQIKIQKKPNDNNTFIHMVKVQL